MRPIVVFCLVLGSSLSARADPIDIELISDTVEGQDRPELILKINAAVSALRVELRGPGDVIDRKFSNLRPGTTKRIELNAPAGSSEYGGQLDAQFADGSRGSMPLTFTVNVMAAWILPDIPFENLALESGRVRLQMPKPAGKCEHDVTIEGSAVLQGVTEFNGEAPGTELIVQWQPISDDDVVLKIRLKCFGTDGSWSGRELYPWWLEIPHDDVIFASGKWEIESTERPKLEAALGEIETALARYGAIVAVKLYVAGHTDTVGTGSSNRVLSLNRARAIAGYFRKRGVRAPMFYAGFGEGGLAVPTADNTDEPRNRRARYVIGVNPPERAPWKRMR